MHDGQNKHNTTPLLEASAIHKSFGRNNVLQGIDLTVRAGEIVSIMGPSGSGKSTLLYCLAGIVDVDSGKILYAGQSLKDLSTKSRTKLRRTDFGFIFQFGELVPELSVRGNIALPLLLRNVKKKQAYALADQWIQAVGLNDVANYFPHTLSGGEVQRAAVARAMAIDPRVIFADEPTGSLDSTNSKNVISLLTKLARDHNKAVVFVTHNQELANYADTQVHIRDGMITHEEA